MWLRPQYETNAQTSTRLNLGQSSAALIRDLQAKLNGSRVGRVGVSTKATGRALARSIASRSTQRNKWTVQARVEFTRCLEEVQLEDITKHCFQVKCCLLLK